MEEDCMKLNWQYLSQLVVNRCRMSTEITTFKILKCL